MKENILFFSAHSDDSVVSSGGSILKFIKEKKQIIKIVFTKGQLSHPHLKDKVITKRRKRETEKIDKIFKIEETIYLNLSDGKLKEEINKTEDEIKKIIKKYNPKKIFIPMHSDPHPDHRAVSKFIQNILKNIKYKKELYEFEVWNIIEENLPQIYIDITPYFKQKIEMMKLYKSQWLFIYPLIIPIYLRAKKFGRKNNCKFAERFYKLK